MEKHALTKKFNFCKVIIAVLLCLFCSFSFAGCVGRMGSGGTSSGGGSGGGSTGGSGSGGGSTGGGPSSGGGSSGGGNEDIWGGGSTGPNIDDFNDVFLGAIAVYDISGDEDVFYDKYSGFLMSYNELVDRQFNTIANYLYSTLNRIYGSTGSGTSLSINGYGTNKTLQYDAIITNADQKILSGLSTGNLNNKEYLNYKNAINGGYTLTVVDNGDETYTTSYDEGLPKSDKAWVGKDYFAISHIKKALGYIYKNQQNAANAASDITLASDTALKAYYANTFSLSNTNVINFDLNTINSLGITRNFIWNVAYYVAYSLIGEANMMNSINNYNVIFSGSQINSITPENYTTLPTALELYKGYNLIVADIVEDLINLKIASNSTLGVGSVNWENTCFPELKKEMYIYYDKIDDVCDANNDDMSGGDDDYGDFGDEGEFDESAMDNIDHGTAFKLKKVLLVPYIDTNKNNISSFEISGLLLGYESETAGTYKVEMSVGGLNKDGGAITPTELEFGGGENVVGNKVTYDETYKFSEDLVDVSITMGSELSNVEIKTGEDGKTIIENSFRSETRNVVYAGGGSKNINIGYINVYNNLFNGSGEFNVSKSILELTFDYYDAANNKLTNIPSTYLMYFYVF